MLERAVILCRTGKIDATHLIDRMEERKPAPTSIALPNASLAASGDPQPSAGGQRASGLDSEVLRAVDSAELHFDDLPLKERFAAIEKASVAHALKIKFGKRSAAAELLAVSRTFFWERCQRYGIAEEEE